MKKPKASSASTARKPGSSISSEAAECHLVLVQTAECLRRLAAECIHYADLLTQLTRSCESRTSHP